VPVRALLLTFVAEKLTGGFVGACNKIGHCRAQAGAAVPCRVPHAIGVGVAHSRCGVAEPALALAYKGLPVAPTECTTTGRTVWLGGIVATRGLTWATARAR